MINDLPITRDGSGKEVGYACVRLVLEEDSHGLFLATRPRKAPRPPEVRVYVCV